MEGKSYTQSVCLQASAAKPLRTRTVKDFFPVRDVRLSFIPNNITHWPHLSDYWKTQRQVHYLKYPKYSAAEHIFGILFAIRIPIFRFFSKSKSHSFDSLSSSKLRNCDNFALIDKTFHRAERSDIYHFVSPVSPFWSNPSFSSQFSRFLRLVVLSIKAKIVLWAVLLAIAYFGFPYLGGASFLKTSSSAKICHFFVSS